MDKKKLLFTFLGVFFLILVIAIQPRAQEPINEGCCEWKDAQQKWHCAMATWEQCQKNIQGALNWNFKPGFACDDNYRCTIARGCCNDKEKKKCVSYVTKAYCEKWWPKAEWTKHATCYKEDGEYKCVKGCCVDRKESKCYDNTYESFCLVWNYTAWKANHHCEDDKCVPDKKHKAPFLSEKGSFILILLLGALGGLLIWIMGKRFSARKT